MKTIAESALKNADIKLSTKATSIDTSDAGVKILTEVGDILEFDEVVVRDVSSSDKIFD